MLVGLTAFCSIESSAVCVPPTGPVIAITGAASLQFTALSEAFKTGVIETLDQAYASSIANAQNTFADQSVQLAMAILETKQTEVNKGLEVKRTMDDLKGSYKLELKKYSDDSDRSVIPLDGVAGGPSESYFAKLCANDKMNKALWGNTSRSVTLNTAKASEFIVAEVNRQNANSRSVDRINQVNHYTKYCSSANGLCEVASEIPNADLVYYPSVNPSNAQDKAVIESTGYKTSYTYSDFEKDAAADYFGNILRVGSLPQVDVDSDVNSNVVAQRLKQLKAAKSLAAYSFNAFQADRTSLDDEGAESLSKLDKLNYIIYKSKTEDFDTAQLANKKGRIIYLMNQQAFKKMLMNEISEKRERLNNLTAAYIAVKQSSPSTLNYFSDIK